MRAGVVHSPFFLPSSLVSVVWGHVWLARGEGPKEGTISVLMIAEIGQDYERRRKQRERESLIQFIYSRLTLAAPARARGGPRSEENEGRKRVNCFFGNSI